MSMFHQHLSFAYKTALISRLVPCLDTNGLSAVPLLKLPFIWYGSSTNTWLTLKFIYLSLDFCCSLPSQTCLDMVQLQSVSAALVCPTENTQMCGSRHTERNKRKCDFRLSLPSLRLKWHASWCAACEQMDRSYSCFKVFKQMWIIKSTARGFNTC